MMIEDADDPHSLNGTMVITGDYRRGMFPGNVPSILNNSIQYYSFVDRDVAIVSQCWLWMRLAV